MTTWRSLTEIAAAAGCNRRTVLRWVERGALAAKWGLLRRGAPGYIVAARDADRFVAWYRQRETAVVGPVARSTKRGRWAK